MSDQAKFNTSMDARAFMTGGNATVTIVSKKTGTRFTYKMRASDDNSTIFVSLLSGPDNEEDFRYLGRIASDTRFWAGRRSPRTGDIHPGAPSAVAFAWVWERLCGGSIPADAEVWHEGRCGRCNRKLTVPSSIASGLGSECASKEGGFGASWA